MATIAHIVEPIGHTLPFKRLGDRLRTKKRYSQERLAAIGDILVGVTVAEQYVISGKDYSGYRPNFTFGVPENTPELEKFYESVPKELRGYYE